MSFIAIPPELQLEIISHLPDLAPGRPHPIGPYFPLTPAISRTSRFLRRESLRLYARNARFTLQLLQNSAAAQTAVATWLDVLEESSTLRLVRDLRIERHWCVGRPERGVGHEGFYLMLRFVEKQGGWVVSGGTYPNSRDERDERVDSVELLEEVVGAWLGGEGRVLDRRSVEFVLRAVDVVVRHHALETSGLEDVLQRAWERSWEGEGKGGEREVNTRARPWKTGNGGGS